MHRFFVPSAEATGSAVALPEDEAVHLMRVLRLRVGDRVRAFDGRGREWDAAVREIAKQRVTVQLIADAPPAPEPRVAITLAAAVLKGDKMDDVVRDAVMLGVTRIVPLLTDRTEIALRAIERGGRIGRWQRIAVASAKQCGRAVVPAVLEAASLAATLDATSAVTRVMFIEPYLHAASDLRNVPAATDVALLVGPEGGWAPSEMQLAGSAGVVLVTLGTQTLRADAAPLVAIAALRALWGDL